METTMQTATETRPAFTEWLKAQQDRSGLVGHLVTAIRLDRQFPLNGSPDDVRKHLNRMQADGDMFEAVDEAETDWLCY